MISSPWTTPTTKLRFRLRHGRDRASRPAQLLDVAADSAANAAAGEGSGGTLRGGALRQREGPPEPRVGGPALPTCRQPDRGRVASRRLSL